MRIRQHHPATIVFLLVKQEDMLTPAPGEAPPVLLSRNGALFTESANQAEPIDDGWYRLLLTAEETDTAGPLIVRAGREDTHEWRDILEVVPPLEIEPGSHRHRRRRPPARPALADRHAGRAPCGAGERRMKLLQRFAAWLAQVTALPVGHPDDGLSAHSAGTPIDKPWPELLQEVEDARQAWRKNPLAKRLVGLITAYTVGNGIQLSSKQDALQAFIQAFWSENRLEQRLDEWSDELVRSGELFPVLYPNPAGGMVQVRIRPASVIERIVWQPGDYEIEVRYQEAVPLGAPEKWWSSPLDPQRPALSPVMLHYAVNRPVGALRGESDLAAILPWLRRYSRWLEDRVRLNAAVRAFLWIVKASAAQGAAGGPVPAPARGRARSSWPTGRARSGRR